MRTMLGTKHWAPGSLMAGSAQPAPCLCLEASSAARVPRFGIQGLAVTRASGVRQRRGVVSDAFVKRKHHLATSDFSPLLREALGDAAAPRPVVVLGIDPDVKGAIVVATIKGRAASAGAADPLGALAAAPAPPVAPPVWEQEGGEEGFEGAMSGAGSAGGAAGGGDGAVPWDEDEGGPPESRGPGGPGTPGASAARGAGAAHPLLPREASQVDGVIAAGGLDALLAARDGMVAAGTVPAGGWGGAGGPWHPTGAELAAEAGRLSALPGAALKELCREGGMAVSGAKMALAGRIVAQRLGVVMPAPVSAPQVRCRALARQRSPCGRHDGPLDHHRPPPLLPSRRTASPWRGWTRMSSAGR